MKSLKLYDIDIVTDKAALSLAAAPTTNTSMMVMKLSWTSTNPDITLKKAAEFIKKSTLRELELDVVTPQPLGKPQVSLEGAREWYWCVEVGGKEFILSLEDSHLESFSITHNKRSSVRHLKLQLQKSLKAAASVNMTRKMNYLSEIKFSICVW